MRKLLVVSALSLVVPFLGGCAEEWSALQEGAQSKYETAEDQYVVIRDAVTMSFLYHWVTGASNQDVPTVDFETQLVVAVLLSERSDSGYSVEVTGVVWTDGNAVVTVTESVTETLNTGVPSRPYAFITMTAPTGDVFFKTNDGDQLLLAEEFVFKPNGLLKLDYASRDFSDTLAPWASASFVPQLDDHVCPFDGTPLEGAPITTTLIGFFCPTGGYYWTFDDSDSYPAPAQVWHGPYFPGNYSNNWTAWPVTEIPQG